MVEAPVTVQKRDADGGSESSILVQLQREGALRAVAPI
jgi:hypothetical protein